jgi:hypothetical protein
MSCFLSLVITANINRSEPKDGYDPARTQPPMATPYIPLRRARGRNGPKCDTDIKAISKYDDTRVTQDATCDWGRPWQGTQGE